MAYNEREKNHQGRNLKERDTEKLMFERPGDASCPVASFEKYISKLNPRCDALFRRPKTNFIADSNCWYDNMAVGKNTLGNKMKVISAEAKCSSVYTNHCVRATAVTALARGGTEHQDICSVTGHKRVDSLHSYLAVPTKADRYKMSKTTSVWIIFNFCQFKFLKFSPKLSNPFNITWFVLSSSIYIDRSGLWGYSPISKHWHADRGTGTKSG